MQKKETHNFMTLPLLLAELLPQKEAAYTLEMIDQGLLKETQLGQEGREWLQRVLSSRPEGG
jgi:hypothetical protein